MNVEGELKLINKRKIAVFAAVVIIVMTLITIPCLAAPGDVSGVIEQTWQSAGQQIKQVVNNVVFPALSLVLVIAFFVKVGGAWFDYRKHGQVEWTAPAILFVCLIFSLIAPQFIWQIVNI